MGSAARSLEFTAPPYGMPVPTPSEADGERQKKTLNEASGAKITAKKLEGNANQPTVTRVPIIPEETPFRLGDLIAATSARVRLDKHTGEPVRHTPQG